MRQIAFSENDIDGIGQVEAQSFVLLDQFLGYAEIMVIQDGDQDRALLRGQEDVVEDCVRDVPILAVTADEEMIDLIEYER